MTSRRRVIGTFLSSWDSLSFQAGRHRRHQTKENLDPIAAPLLAFNFAPAGYPRILTDIPPWGILMPAESIETGIPFYTVSDTAQIPLNTVVTARAAIEGGATYENSYTYEMIYPDVFVDMPSAWFASAAGKRVVVNVELAFPDGETFTSPPTEFRFHPFLEVSPIAYEDLPFGQPLNPEAFPNGLIATVDRVRQIEAFHYPIVVNFQVRGFTSDGSLKTVGIRQFDIEDLRETPFTTTLDPEFYSGRYDDGQLTNIHIRAELYAFMTPMDYLIGAQMRFIMGNTDILPPQK